MEDCGYDHRLYQTKEYKIGTSFFSAKYTASRSKSKAYLTLNLDTVFLLEWHVYPSPVQSGYCIPTWVTCLPVTCSVWILYSYLSDMSTRHLFSLDTVFLLEWHVYLSPVQSGYCIPTWVTCLPVTCSVCILYSYLSDMSTHHLFNLDTLFLLEWHVYPSPVQSGYCIPTYVTCLPVTCSVWILYSYLSDMSTRHLFNLDTLFLLEWHVYPSPVQSGYCIPTWVTCLPITCSVWILYSYLSDMSTRHLFSLYTVFLLEWHVYPSPVQSGYCIPTWVTCLPVTCSVCILYSYLSDMSTHHLFSLDTVFLLEWHVYLSPVQSVYCIPTWVTCLPVTCSVWILYSYLSDMSTCHLFSLDTVFLLEWHVYPSPVQSGYCIPTWVTCLPITCSVWILYSYLSDMSTCHLFNLDTVFLLEWHVYLSPVQSGYCIPTWVTCLPVTCSVWILYSYLSDMSTRHLFSLYTVFLLEWHVYLSPVQSGYCIPTWVTCLPVTCSVWILYSYLSDMSTHHLFSLDTVFLLEWHVYLSPVQSVYCIPTWVTCLPITCSVWILYSYLSDMSTCHLFSLDTVFLLEWHVYPSPVQSVYCIPTWVTCLPITCSVWILYSYLSDMSTHHLFSLYTVFLLEWHVYPSPVQSGYCIPTWVTCLPVTCSVCILYSYLSDMSTHHLFSLDTVFLLEWHVYPSPVQSGYCIPTWVTCLPVTCSVWILYSYLSDMSTRHLFSLDTVFLLEWHVYLSPVQSGYCIPTWVTCLPVTCSVWILYSYLSDMSTHHLFSLDTVFLLEWHVYLSPVQSGYCIPTWVTCLPVTCSVWILYSYLSDMSTCHLFSLDTVFLLEWHVYLSPVQSGYCIPTWVTCLPVTCSVWILYSYLSDMSTCHLFSLDTVFLLEWHVYPSPVQSGYCIPTWVTCLPITCSVWILYSY